MKPSFHLILVRAASILVLLLVGILWRLNKTPTSASDRTGNHEVATSPRRAADELSARSRESIETHTQKPSPISKPNAKATAEQELVQISPVYLEKIFIGVSFGSVELDLMEFQNLGFSENEISEIAALLHKSFEEQMKISATHLEVIEMSPQRIKLLIKGDPERQRPSTENTMSQLRAICGDSAPLVAPFFNRAMVDNTDDYGSRTQVILIERPPDKTQINHSFWINDTESSRSDLGTMDIPALEKISHGYRRGTGGTLPPSTKYYLDHLPSR